MSDKINPSDIDELGDLDLKRETNNPDLAETPIKLSITGWVDDNGVTHPCISVGLSYVADISNATGGPGTPGHVDRTNPMNNDEWWDLFEEMNQIQKDMDYREEHDCLSSKDKRDWKKRLKDIEKRMDEIERGLEISL